MIQIQANFSFNQNQVLLPMSAFQKSGGTNKSYDIGDNFVHLLLLIVILYKRIV